MPGYDTKTRKREHADRKGRRPVRPCLPAGCTGPLDVLEWLRPHVPGVSILTLGEQRAEQGGSLKAAVGPALAQEPQFTSALLVEASSSDWPVAAGFQVLALLAPAEPAKSPAGDLAGHYAVLGRKGNARLTALFSTLDKRRDYGRVSLVGFGPGDPDLMTLKAHHALRSADVIFYDDLIDRSVLGRYRARSVYVGKRKGRSDGRQEAINRMLCQSAVRGETVVRLKGGDPFVLGRGGEEVDYLERRFVSVDVVPGITSALAAAADFGIPLTLRGASRGLEIRTGHTKCPDVRPGRCETSVYYMAASRLGGLGEELLRSGFDPDLPAAIVEKASLPGRRCRFTKIGKLADQDADGPALLIVGPTLDYAPRKPTLLFTGLSPHRFRGPERLVHYPLIERRGGEEIVAVEKSRIDLQEFDGVVFTHELAIDQFLRIWGSLPELVYATSPSLSRKLIRDHHCQWIVHSF